MKYERCTSGQQEKGMTLEILIIEMDFSEAAIYLRSPQFNHGLALLPFNTASGGD